VKPIRGRLWWKSIPRDVEERRFEAEHGLVQIGVEVLRLN
jgi:hypothetical protein